MPHGQFTRALRRLRHLVAPGTDQTDRQLLERFAITRDEEPFAQLVRRHGPMVLGICRRVLSCAADADDAFQATFLVLARKAGASFWRESVAGWLSAVAFRTASKMRVGAARRRRYEQQAALVSQPAIAADDGWAEVRQVLDEELVRLPEKYRLPLLLCCLQDLTVDEAAQKLGWTWTMVKGRLQRGRELLRGRLSRRGVPLPAGVLTVLLAQGVVTAAPEPLLTTTVQAAIAGPCSAPVAALAKGVMQTMFWSKFKFVAVAVLVIGILGAGIGILTWRPGTPGQPPVARASTPTGEAKAAPASPLDKQALVAAYAQADVVFIGRVVEADLTAAAWPGFVGMFAKKVVYEVTAPLKGKTEKQTSVHYLISGEYGYLLREDGGERAPQLDGKRFARGSKHLVCVQKEANDKDKYSVVVLNENDQQGSREFVLFVTPDVEAALVALVADGARNDAKLKGELGSFYPDAPMLARLKYVGGVPNWDADMSFDNVKATLQLRNSAVFVIKDAKGNVREMRADRITSARVNALLAEPFEVIVDLRLLCDLSTPGEYTLEWGSRQLRSSLKFTVIARP
ncbi:MAG: RNA polymerase sigma factor [Gemmataceae bacterium]|nr:RNA polymerase sigma factor [Gemmataceae bacterium]